MRVSLIERFGSIKDPRIDRHKLYPLDEILLVALATVLSGGDSYEDMRLFGLSKLEFFRTLLPFENGIPSADTYERVLGLLDPRQFQGCFLAWVEDLKELLPDVLAIDGKTLRRSGKGSSKPLHMVSVWAVKNRLVLGAQAIEEKSNEITAIPKLLELVNLKGAIVTLDAMGCQTEIAEQIINQGGDFVLALKGNQGALHQDVKEFFEQGGRQAFEGIQLEEHTTIDKGHGRIETRHYGLWTEIKWLKERHPQWSCIRSIGFVHAQRDIKGKIQEETRYYISSLDGDVRLFGEAVRGHWGVETSLHWTLDVTFREDHSRIRYKTATENLAIMRRAALSLIERDTDKKSSKKGKRLKAGWSNDYLKALLLQQF